jgi:arylsulfatase A-like enzyme
VAAAAPLPRRAAVILLDSLNRHHLGCYGGTEFATPNLDRFAAGAVRFERHYVGSLPCMPARHDLLCGALDFLWKPWGSIELWEEPITVALRRAGIPSMLVSDHPHLFEVGGENYHTDFSAWRYERGHESDPWRTHPDPSWVGSPILRRGFAKYPYDLSRGWFRGEEDFPGPRTMTTAARWLAEEARHHERFLLFVDEFDPHEPFDTPERWARRYDPDWEGAHLIWPPYVVGARERGILTERQARQIRACYGAKLSMIDHWLGRVLDAIDAQGMAEDTAVFITTDHGHYLGEKDVFGKPGVPIQEPMGHIPLLVRWPGAAPRTERALTTNLDVFATLLEIFGVAVKQRTHGHSLAPVVRGEARSVREWALAGTFGRQVSIFDGEWNYARGPAGVNAPLSMWSNRWSTMPVHHLPDFRLPVPDDRAFLDRMPGSRVPVIRQPFQEGDLLPFWSIGTPPGNHLWHVAEDPAEARDVRGGPEEKRVADLLRAALAAVEAPADQLERLGLA